MNTLSLFPTKTNRKSTQASEREREENQSIITPSRMLQGTKDTLHQGRKSLLGNQSIITLSWKALYREDRYYSHREKGKSSIILSPPPKRLEALKTGYNEV